MDYKNKKIAVLGAGESGEAAAILLAEEHAMVTLLDGADEKKLQAKIDGFRRLGLPISVIAGEAASRDTGHYDRAIISPGIDPAVPLVQNFIRRRIDMIGELELAYELCKCPVVAITGTNGKTTTTQLVERMFNGCGVRTIACGNISPAFAATVRKSSELDIMTLEVSSFQLEQIRTFRPRIAVWLNLSANHLDRYNSMEEYRDAKLNIFQNQTEEDVAVVNLRDTLPPLKARKITFSAYQQGGDFELRGDVIFHHGEPVLKMSETKLRGLHNAENLMAALAVGYAHGLGHAQMVEPLSTYTALPHRCEFIRRFEEVDYINDSKSTNLDSLEKALMSETRPIVLIAGGKDKGFEFDALAELVGRKAHHAILIGQMADRIASSWKAGVACEKADSLSHAVQLARAHAKAGDAVLFSPGTSSFDMFKSYEDRGNQFRALVLSLT
ncbi:MAG: UDP-N-acetylmuramoyl-L-alanine--D-glutamate ligase [Chthoniobacteraceae bacterium]